MASFEEVIASKDAEAIKRKRTAIQSMITVVRNSLEKLLVKTDAGAYDHAKTWPEFFNCFLLPLAINRCDLDSRTKVIPTKMVVFRIENGSTRVTLL